MANYIGIAMVKTIDNRIGLYMAPAYSVSIGGRVVVEDDGSELEGVVLFYDDFRFDENDEDVAALLRVNNAHWPLNRILKKISESVLDWKDYQD